MKFYYYRKTLCLALILAGSFTQFALAQEADPKFALIPYPSSLTEGKGSFTISSSTAIVSADRRFDNEAAQLNLLIKQYLKTPLKQLKSATAGKSILLKYDGSITAPEGYRLAVTAGGIVLSAKEPAGAFRAIETLRQLLPAEERSAKGLKSVSVPAVTIADQPAYAWRGMHLDVSRHFFL